MRNMTRLASLVTGTIAIATLAACSSYGPGPTYSTAPTYSTYPTASYPVAGTEFGRVVNVEYLPVGSTVGTNNILGAVIGGVAGVLLGNQIGSGSGRSAATVLGAVGGAVVGQHLARNSAGATTQAGYRITVQTDQGVMRTYEVPATGDLRVGDRVRVDNGVIYRA